MHFLLGHNFDLNRMWFFPRWDMRVRRWSEYFLECKSWKHYYVWNSWEREISLYSKSIRRECACVRARVRVWVCAPVGVCVSAGKRKKERERALVGKSICMWERREREYLCLWHWEMSQYVDMNQNQLDILKRPNRKPIYIIAFRSFGPTTAAQIWPKTFRLFINQKV